MVRPAAVRPCGSDAVAVAGVAVLGGFTSAPQSIGWAMAIGGGFMTMVVGESGSITHVMATGVTRTSYSFVVAGLLVAGLGVALIMLSLRLRSRLAERRTAAVR